MTSTILPLSEPFGRIHVRREGPDTASAAPLVLIHGVGLNVQAWEPQIAAFSKVMPVVALDMPGHGGSDPLHPGARLETFVAWFCAALDGLGLGRVNLVGHSMGALITGGVAATAPQRVERVALLNGVYRRSEAARQAVIARADEIARGHADITAPLDRWFTDTPQDQAIRQDVAAWLGAVDIGGYATAYGAFARGDATFADAFARISCPLLALTGSDDPNSTPDMAQSMAVAAPRGQAAVINGHRHMVNLTAPEAVNAALTKWLEIPVDAEDAA